MKENFPAPVIAAASVDRGEYRKFEALSENWWDPSGPFKPLHDMNAARMPAIVAAMRHRWHRDGGEKPLEGLRILDVGCGGGLAAEALARLGARVTAIDIVENTIQAARHHAETAGLTIDYRLTTAEDLAAKGETFDVVLALEVVEHVANLANFIGTLARLVHEGGQLFIATLNRTVSSYLFAIVGAEYILRKLPRGTHDWKRFRKPTELHALLIRHGLTVERLQGMTYNPFNRLRWRISNNLSVNYLLRANRAIS